MTATSPSAFLLSATLHAVVVGLLLLFGYASTRSAKEPEKIFQVVAGEGDNYAATVAPALGVPGGAKTKSAATPTKAPPPSDMAKSLRRSVIKAESAAKQQAARERAAEAKRLAEERKQQELQAKAEAAAQSKAKTLPGKSKAPPQIAKIDTEGIVKGVLGGSTENTKGGAGGTALKVDHADVLEAYFAMFKQRVRDSFEPPAGASDSLRGEFEFRILANGAISNARVLKSSGNREFDQAVLAAIRQVKMPAHPYSRAETASFWFTMREKDTG